jgi:hypothetical protein
MENATRGLIAAAFVLGILFGQPGTRKLPRWKCPKCKQRFATRAFALRHVKECENDVETP